MKQIYKHSTLTSIIIFGLFSVFTSCNTYVESTNIKMVYVKGATIEGEIQAEGTTESSIFTAGNKITIPNLYVSDHEISQFEVIKHYPSYKTRIEEYEKCVGDTYPAYNINWFDTLIYCNNRSIAEGLTPCYTIKNETNPEKWGKIPKSSSWETWNDWIYAKCDFSADGYRLPTTAEWEYVARGGNGLKDYQYKYSGSDILSEVAWYNTDSVHEIKQKKPNSLGIYDMSGNLDEWCWDRYGGDSYRLYCGGYYYFKDETSFLLSKKPSLANNMCVRNSQLGFRVVRTAK